MKKLLCVALAALPILFSQSSPAAGMLAAGDAHSIALNRDGTLQSWGNNNVGQLGNGSTTSSSIPVRIPSLSGVVAVAAGYNHGVALKSNGYVWAWGDNRFGQLANFTGENTSIPMLVMSDSNCPTNGIIAIAAGNQHSLAIRGADRTICAWGNNQYGQLGDGKTAAKQDIPVKVAGLSGVSTVAAGADFTLALKSDGTVWAWGNNTAGQLGDGTTKQRNLPAQVTGFDRSVIAIAAGYCHGAALTDDGAVWAWGRAGGSMGCLGAPSSYTPGIPHRVAALSSGVRQLVAGSSIFAIKTDGTVWKAGDPIGDRDFSNATHLADLNGTIELAAGKGLLNGTLLALKPDGTVWAQGDNISGEIGDGTFSQRLSAVLVVNDTMDGPLDLFPEIPNNIPSEKTPPFLMKVMPTAIHTNVLVKYDPQTLGKNGNVFIVGFVKANSPLLPNKNGFSALPPDTVIPVMLTRSGFKQMGSGVPVDSAYSGPLDNNNNAFALYDPANFDNTKDFGIFCVGYATGVGTPSAKGQIRAAVTGQVDGAYQCPPIQVENNSRYTATSNDRNDALSITAAITPRTEDLGKNANIYVWAVAPDGRQFMKTGNDWGAMSEPLGVTQSMLLENSMAVSVVNGLDLRSLVGTQAYVGYGVSEKDMRDNGRYGLVYTIR